MTHICVSELTIIGSDNGLLPDRHQAIIWTNAGILLFRPLGTNFNEILIEIHIISFKKIHLKMSSGKWRPFCLGLNVSLCPNEAIRWHRSGSTLAQVMASCQMAPSHYLNHWLIIRMVQPNSSDGNSSKIPQPSITEISLKITYLKFN